MKNLAIITAAVAIAAFSGCTTTTAYVAPGEDLKIVGGFSQQDMEYVVKLAVDDLRKWNGRFADAEGKRRRVVNVMNITPNTTTRGGEANIIAEDMGQMLREEMTNDGTFIVYNPRLAYDTAAAGRAVVRPEFVLYGKINERNLRKDNGDFYREYSLNLQLVGAPENSTCAGLEVWQKRIPLRKVIDRKNILN